MTTLRFVSPPFLKTEYERQPWLLIILAFLIPAFPPYMLPYPSGRSSPDFLIPAALLILTALGFIDRRRTVRKPAVNVGVVGLIVYALVQVFLYSFVHPNSPNSVYFLNGASEADVSRLVAMAGVSLYTITQVKTGKARELILGALTIGIGYSCLIAILQAYAEIDWRLLLVPPGFTEFPQSGRPADAVVNVATSARFGAPRAFSTFNHPAEFAMFAAIFFPLAIHFARFSDKPWLRRLSVGAIPLGLFGLLAGASRTGVLALTVALLFYAAALPLRRLVSTVVLCLSAFYAATLAAPQSVFALSKAITLGAEGEEGSAQARLDDYAFVETSFRDSPWIGKGFGMLYPPGSDGALDNQWLLAVVQGGVVGLIGIATLGAAGLLGLRSSLHAASGERDRDQARATGAAFLGVLCASFVSNTLTITQSLLVFPLLYGLLWSYQSEA